MQVAAGATVFRVDNPRFGNLEAMSQLNWIQELVDRLRVESAEAELHYAKQEELFKGHEALFKDQVISPHGLSRRGRQSGPLREYSANSKKDQLRAAEARSRDIEKQLALHKHSASTMPFDGVVWSVRYRMAAK